MDITRVRLQSLTNLDISYEKSTKTAWLNDYNIERGFEVIQRNNIEHIHLQTSHLDFLKDSRLKNIKGITIQFEISDISPLFNYVNLTHLGLPDNVKAQFDFSKFPKLIYLSGSMPKSYINFDSLENLKYTYLFNYRKKDFEDFSNCKELKTLEVYSLGIESLNGLSELRNLYQVNLENCRKLKTLDGLSKNNDNLQKIHLINCKALKNADAVANLSNIKQLWLFNILELNSLEFLYKLDNIETLVVHPSKVGVKNNDYYPLVDTLSKLNKLDNLKGWKPLTQYLNREFIVNQDEKIEKSELSLLKDNLCVVSWVEKGKDGLKQYSKKNCKKAEQILVKLINNLEQSPNIDQTTQIELIKNCIIELNEFNKNLKGAFIETQEREELCNLFDNIADTVGIDVQNYSDGIASLWREW